MRFLLANLVFASTLAVFACTTLNRAEQKPETPSVMIAPEYKVEIKDDAIQTQAGPGSDLYEPIKGKGLKVKKDKPETGLQKGDIVIKAFGQKLKGESAEEVSQALVESQNAPMILEVERKGKVVVLDLQIITLKKTEEKKKTNK